MLVTFSHRFLTLIFAPTRFEARRTSGILRPSIDCLHNAEAIDVIFSENDAP